jgi:hypothetical protein
MKKKPEVVWVMSSGVGILSLTPVIIHPPLPRKEWPRKKQDKGERR